MITKEIYEKTRQIYCSMNESDAKKAAQNYRYWRKKGIPAHEAITRAKADVENRTRRYASTLYTGYGPRFESGSEKHLRWIENPAECGLRRVGFADEHCEYIDHRGWYTDDDGMNGEVYRGSVYLLPGRNGAPVFVYGYDDPCNPGACLLSFDVVYGEAGYFSAYEYNNPEFSDAARYADSMAESFAERERDYQRAWRAGRDFEEKGDEIGELRREALAIIRDLKSAGRFATSGDFPAACETLRNRVSEIRERIAELREEREELESWYGDCEGFVE